MTSKLLFTVLITILLVVYAYLGIGYMKQRGEREALTSQITEVTETLREMPKLPQDIEPRLAAAQASLVAEQSIFSIKVNSTEVINTILELADDSGVKAVPLVTEPWSIQDVEEHGYYVFRLNVVVEGSLSDFSSFVSKLENGRFRTLVVEDLNVIKVSEQSKEESVSEGTISVVASLDLAIYTQSLISD